MVFFSKRPIFLINSWKQVACVKLPRDNVPEWPCILPPSAGGWCVWLIDNPDLLVTLHFTNCLEFLCQLHVAVVLPSDEKVTKPPGSCFEASASIWSVQPSYLWLLPRDGPRMWWLWLRETLNKTTQRNLFYQIPCWLIYSQTSIYIIWSMLIWYCDVVEEHCSVWWRLEVGGGAQSQLSLGNILGHCTATPGAGSHNPQETTWTFLQ